MPRTVYVETSIVSYLAARPSRDLVVAARYLSSVRRTNSWERAMTDVSKEQGSWRDPIVAEVRCVRQALFAAAGGDIREFCRRLRERQAASGHRLVTRARRNSSAGPGRVA